MIYQVSTNNYIGILLKIIFAVLSKNFLKELTADLLILNSTLDSLNPVSFDEPSNLTALTLVRILNCVLLIAENLEPGQILRVYLSGHDAPGVYAVLGDSSPVMPC